MSNVDFFDPAAGVEKEEEEGEEGVEDGLLGIRERADDDEA